MNGNEHSLTPRSAGFRKVITAFIEERRDTKLKGLSGEKAAATAAKYEYHTWLADAARRAPQIQAVTHVLKASHPDARGSSLYVPPDSMPQRQEVGSHSLKKDFAEDIVGNAAALDVYKFLKLQVDGQRLLDWLQADDPDLLAALHSESSTAKQWAESFKTLVRPAESLVSHSMAKQVYWCISGEPADDAGYHLIQPFFSSSLAHEVHQNITYARSGDANKAARQAYKKKEACDATYQDYRGLAVRKLGGTKPQNISQLNSERGGVNYLLASLPPLWNQRQSANFLGIDSALGHFQRFGNVSKLLKELVRLLKSHPDPTFETRKKREAIERSLGTALSIFGLTTRQRFQPGWTRHEDCQLPLCEMLWLDPDRAKLPEREGFKEKDDAFKSALEWKDWPDEVASRFANWVNDVLVRAGLPVGSVEAKHWAKQAIVDTEWPAPIQRRFSKNSNAEEMAHD